MSMVNKPKLYKNGNWWVCEGLKLLGIANHPEAAYLIWKNQYAKTKSNVI